MGVGGGRLQATGRCIYLMEVSEILNFDTYWSDKRFRVKKPVRNGSPVMMVGDNIYHRDATENWIQEDSHHSNPDGTTNLKNLATDTKSINVLISTHFYYFGNTAPLVDLSSIGYTKNGIGHRKKSFEDANVVAFVKNIEDSYRRDRNIVIADPINFEHASKRVDQKTGKIS